MKEKESRNMKMNKVEKSTVMYRALNEEQCREIAAAAIRILGRTGCVIQNEKAVALLKEAGCVTQGDHVWIPETLIRWALDAAPESITLYNRDGEPAMRAEPGEFNFGPVTSTCDIIDIKTGERRKSVKKDLEEAAVLMDSLENLAWASDCLTLSDVNPAYCDITEVSVLLQNTRKPFWYYAQNIDNLKIQFEMFETVAGGEDKLRLHPFTVNLICPLDALRHSDNGMEQIMYCAEKGAPVVYIPGTEFGLTSPATMAGTIAAGIADCLPALVVSQLTAKGAPFIAACFRNNVDFSTMALDHSRPEMIAANIATADVWRYLGLPFCCNMANTDNGDFGPQAVFEKTAQYYSVMLAGINMCYGVGCYEAGMVLRYADWMFSNEVIEYLKRLVCGFSINEETLAENLIDEVGPGGVYLMEEHTMEHIHDFWVPQLLKSRKMGKGAALEQDLADAAAEIIAKGPQNELDAAKKAAIAAIMSRVEAEYSK
ncbi:MAG: trimethylamine methyltransferase family protein [Lachnospiraceae bacterium]|nr:trimethylamine methyltransferase family protein [Lachnospiraceae bacterium]